MFHICESLRVSGISFSFQCLDFGFCDSVLGFCGSVLFLPATVLEDYGV